MRHGMRRGYTLIEMLVVIAILGLAAAIVLPALVRSRLGAPSLQTVIDHARDAAARRGELIYVRIEPTGAWHLEGAGSPLELALASGRVAPLAREALTLLVSPAGTCAFDVRSAAAGRAFAIDPLTCTVGRPPTAAPSSS